MELPFGGDYCVSDDFTTGTIAAAHGGNVRRLSISRFQYKGEPLIQGVDNCTRKLRAKCAIDYGFHLITTELEDKQIEEMYTVMDEGVTASRCSWLIPAFSL
jgi:dihydropyrimidinase